MLTARIRCIVIRVPEPAEDNGHIASPSRHERFSQADPYILGLIAKLQHEIKTERAARFEQARAVPFAPRRPR